MPESVPVTAAWLRRIGDNVHLLLEIDGQWSLIVDEPADGPFSWIAEAGGFHAKPLDPVTAEGRRA